MKSCNFMDADTLFSGLAILKPTCSSVKLIFHFVIFDVVSLAHIHTTYWSIFITFQLCKTLCFRKNTDQETAIYIYTWVVQLLLGVVAATTGTAGGVAYIVRSVPYVIHVMVLGALGQAWPSYELCL